MTTTAILNHPEIEHRSVKKAVAKYERLRDEFQEYSGTTTMLEQRLAAQRTPEAIERDRAALVEAVKAGKGDPGNSLGPAESAVQDAHRRLDALRQATMDAAADVRTAIEEHLPAIREAWERESEIAREACAGASIAVEAAHERLAAAERRLAWADDPTLRWPRTGAQVIEGLLGPNGEPHLAEAVFGALHARSAKADAAPKSSPLGIGQKLKQPDTPLKTPSGLPGEGAVHV
jgi:hypothetical protein